MQSRSKWQSKKENVKVGDIVILKDDMASRNHWPLARVVEAVPGKDGLVRHMKSQMADAELDEKADDSTLLSSSIDPFRSW